MITAISIPFLALYNVGAAIFRTMGNSKLPMQIMLAMNIAHAIGNAILIYGFHFGTAGVAIPTLISRIALAYILGIYFHMGMFGTWVAMFIDWIVKSMIYVGRYMNGKWTRFHAI